MDTDKRENLNTDPEYNKHIPDWTLKHEQAVYLVLEDTLKDYQIAEKLGVAISTLERWKTSPVFKARLSEVREKLKDALFKEGLRSKEVRIAKLEQMYKKLEKIIIARSKDSEFLEVAGGNEGYHTFFVKPVGGRNPQAFKEYQIDFNLLKQLQDIKLQIAKELGDLNDNANAVAQVKAYIGINVEEV